ncbi:MAG: M23 family metallopeptidase [Candidatus Portnoybacteria bacterium]|nr:M23 family metallopeptidase [Candidatus Portnoybacteria bacterium]
MQNISKKGISVLVIAILVLTGIVLFVLYNRYVFNELEEQPAVKDLSASEKQDGIPSRAQKESPQEQSRRVSFTKFNLIYRFSGAIPSGWEIAYIPEIQAINIYNPSLSGEDTTEKSQIFIRNFSANNFLTLSTVAISQRKSTKVKGHDAVEYEITKKPGVPNFPRQPSWRNSTHHSTDIRFSAQNPSPFYTIGYNPGLERKALDEFLASLQFHNDRESFEPVIERLKERVIKKPFGVLISPQNSPIENERFSGYHTGIDVEVFDDELEKDVLVKALCGGVLRQKQYAKGYGGVATEECLFNDQVATVVYGHLNLQSISASEGDYINPGDTIGFLGAHLSQETDGERKHLHFGIRKGKGIDIRGYVPSPSQLSPWIDPQEYLSN